MAFSQSQMLQSIYDTLFGAFTKPPAGSDIPVTSPPDKTYLTLNWPGNQIDVAQFADPWTPQNQSGSTAATESFSTFVDRVPTLHPIFSDSGKKVSESYAMILKAQVIPPPPDPAAEAAYARAMAFLHAEGTDFGPDGKPVKVQVDSPIYANYKRKRIAYDNAVAGLMAVYGQYDLSKPDEQRKWSLLGLSRQSAVSMAYDDLVAAQATKVDDMVATLSTSAENQVGQLFDEARERYANIGRASIDNPGVTYRPSYGFPANWYSTSAAETWSSISISSKNLKTDEHSDFRDIAAQAEAKGGIWSVGGNFDMNDSHQKMSSETSDLTIEFKFARIDIHRPWLNMLLLDVGGWRLNDVGGPGSISTGTKDSSANSGSFPLLPTAFIAVRDLKISAKWGKEDRSLIEAKLAAKATLSYGPYSVSGSYAHGSTDKKFDSAFDGTTLSNSGLQIVGWINAVVPFAPPRPRETKA